ncbi:MAG TPA: hypothetical protein VMM84_13995 [Pyrinomonadaceae bacterium]|nr:hypothetical protein [Pyrinomonadaceae bacterium]
MKRCPECEFVYEDEQQSCDMDGAELVHDLRFLAENLSSPIDLKFARPTEPELNNEATSLLVINSSPPQTPRYWPRLGGVAIAAAVLSTALSLAYITSTQSHAPSDGRITLTENARESASATTEQVEERAPAETSAILPASGIEAAAIDPAQPPTGTESPKATPRVQNSQGRNGHRNHRSDSGEPTSTSRSKIVGPVTTVTTVRMTDKGAAISTRSDGSAQTTLRAPSISAKSAPARAENRESRVGSFLRTAGRIIKKPFK